MCLRGVCSVASKDIACLDICWEQLGRDSCLCVCISCTNVLHSSFSWFVNITQISATEAANISRCFKSKDFTAFMSGGIHAESTKYQFLREEDGKLVLGKKKGVGAITLQASKTAIVIGHTPEGCQQGNTNKGVGVIADYLESMNM